MTLLMIPGPIETSPAVQAAAACAPPSHVSPQVLEAFGRSLELMRHVWLASQDSQPFILAGSGTLAMDMAVQNLLEPGDSAVVVNTGYFSDRITTMLKQRGVEVISVKAPSIGDVPSLEQIAQALEQTHAKALIATHVDTSTGVRVDAQAIARLARQAEVLSIFDGVCATAGERFEMEAWGADVYLTASQKAIGLAPGLALLVASPRALSARAALKQAPMMSIDFDQWRPIMEAYEARKPSYFATPATPMIMSLKVGLDEILADELGGLSGMQARFARHEAVASRARERWRSLGLELVPKREELAANTLSALYYPQGHDAALVGRIKDQGVVVAGGLHPEIKARYFRVGHMGYSATQEDHIQRTLDAIEAALK